MNKRQIKKLYTDRTYPMEMLERRFFSAKPKRRHNTIERLYMKEHPDAVGRTTMGITYKQLGNILRKEYLSSSSYKED